MTFAHQIPSPSALKNSLAGPLRLSLALLATVAIGQSGCAVEDNAWDDSVASDSTRADSQVYELRINTDTTFKISTAQSSELLLGSEKCRLPAGSKLTSLTSPQFDDKHLLVELATPIPGCEFTFGFLFASHVDGAGGANGLCHADISVRECALLSTIAYAEGTKERYDIIFSFQTFTSFADHPRRRLCSAGGYCSDAAGRYQFLSTTWDGTKRALGLRDFSPTSQDLGALYLIRNRGVTDINNIDNFLAFEDAMYGLNNEWASLPGSPYGQPTHSASSLWAKYRQFAGL